MATYFVTQAGAGSQNGSNLSNAWSVANFNTSSNWSASIGAAGKISPNDTVMINGTITSQLIVQGSGLANNPITILFASGALMQNAAWGTTGAINIAGLSFIIVDGGAVGRIGGYNANGAVNGFIQNTGNGTNLPNQNDTCGVLIQDSTNVTVQNLGIYNLFVRTVGTGVGFGAAVCSKWNGGTSSTNITANNLLIHDAAIGVNIDYAPNAFNFTVSNVTAYNCNWGGNAGDHGATSTMSNLVVSGCYFHDWTNWDAADGTSDIGLHHNGFYAWAQSNGRLSGVTFIDNFIGPNYCHVAPPNNSTAGLFISGPTAVGPFLICNNTFICNSGDNPSDGLIFVWPGDTSTTRIYNNTLLSTSAGNSINLFGSNLLTGATFDVKNNLFTGNTAINVFNNGLITLTSNNNVFYNLLSGTNFGWSSNGSTAAQTYATWKALAFSPEINSNTGNPNLGANFVPQIPSFAIQSGANLSSFFTTDAIGNNRPSSGPWDIGAYQFLIYTIKRLGLHPQFSVYTTY